ncbi:TetR/AcrR family transcriptional regulator [Streptomyces sp. NPDC002536]
MDDERAERILGAARELLLRWGYKRVTVDDVARRAQVGKGTLYLHWKTKEELFTTLLRREFAAMLADVAARIEEDPAGVLPHRLLRCVYLERLRHPIVRAIHAEDDEVLGALLTTAPTGVPLTEELRIHTTLADIVCAQSRHGLLVPVERVEEQVYAIDSVLIGFFFTADTGALPLERQGDLLAETVRAAFEPRRAAGAAAVRAAAREVLGVLGEARKELCP